MKKLVLLVVLALLATATVIYAQTSKDEKSELPEEVVQWERLAEKGDTTALHKLLRFFDENSNVYVEVEEVIEVEAEEVYDDSTATWQEVAECDSVVVLSPEIAELYASRLEYWLDKGLAIDDPVATFVKGMRLYYADEAQALQYLTKSADGGNLQAALFCGAAFYNQDQIDNAIKYQTIAYNGGVPSAGWHLAMCLARKGDDEDINKAIEYMRHSAMLNYPEAVLEMKHIEPNNKLWQHKANSLEISFPDFEIIPTE